MREERDLRLLLDLPHKNMLLNMGSFAVFAQVLAPSYPFWLHAQDRGQ